MGLIQALRILTQWPRRRFLAAVAISAATAVLLAVPADLINTPYFSRDIAPTWWSWPVLLLNSALTGLLTASYIARTDTATESARGLGIAGTAATFFAIGCPVCNKLVLLALGYSGALQFFEPVQPYLAIAATALLTWALWVRTAREYNCTIPQPPVGNAPTHTPSHQPTPELR